MRKHQLRITSLEEHEPNGQFVGRNFNGGEVIQLVLRPARRGGWFPLEYVQMVMMHELAHCKHMNHSRAFWAVRNAYVSEMHTLWRDGYTGDGIWGRGATLATGEWTREVAKLGDDAMPEHVCGGTYRLRRGKRRRAVSYREREQRRIARKFGPNGVALGADDEMKMELEKGKKVSARPRVAGSARGRELRAAAALARLERQTDVVAEAGGGAEEEEDDDEEEDGDDEEGEAGGEGGRTTKLVRVSEGEDPEESEAKNERDELRNVFQLKEEEQQEELVVVVKEEDEEKE